MSQVFDIVVPAAGIGTRMSASLGISQAKQYLELNGTPILERTLNRLFELDPRRICLVVAEDDDCWQKLPITSQCEIAIGGASRADSVRAGLKKLNCEDSDLVMVHDSVRPLVKVSAALEVVAAAASHAGGALLANRVVDTLKYSSNGETIVKTVDREDYWQAQTPQVFPAGILCSAMDQAETNQTTVTDEASAVEAMGLAPALVSGPRDNIKITTAEDLKLAEFLLERDQQ